MISKTSAQNKMFHAMARDISRQVLFAGRKWRDASWKRLLCEAYINVERGDAYATGKADPFPELVMLVEGLDGYTIVQLGAQVRHFTIEQMSGLIESCFAFGCENEVVWSKKTQQQAIDMRKSIEQDALAR